MLFQLSATPTCVRDSLMIKISLLCTCTRLWCALFGTHPFSEEFGVCASEKEPRGEFYYGLFSRKRNYGNKTHIKTSKQAPAWRSPQKALANTHTKEQYKTPHVQCLCTRVWETHIIGYQFDNEAGSEARFSFADCFLGVSIR